LHSDLKDWKISFDKEPVRSRVRIDVQFVTLVFVVENTVGINIYIEAACGLLSLTVRGRPCDGGPVGNFYTVEGPAAIDVVGQRINIEILKYIPGV
jgi:hypothetical protein